MSDSEVIASNASSNRTIQFTVGVSIVVIVIAIVGFIHLWRYLFKKLLQYIAHRNQFYMTTNLESVMTTPPPAIDDGRKLTSTSVHQFEKILKTKDFPDKRNIHRPSLQCIPEECDSIELQRSRTICVKTPKNSTKFGDKKFRHSAYAARSSAADDKVTFLAGFSHRHINDA